MSLLLCNVPFYLCFVKSSWEIYYLCKFICSLPCLLKYSQITIPKSITVYCIVFVYLWAYDHWLLHEFLLQQLESSITFLFPLEDYSLLCHVVKALCDVTVVQDKITIIRAHTIEMLNFLCTCGHCDFVDGLDLWLITSDSQFTD